MTVIVMIAIVGAAVQTIKEAADKVRIKIEGWMAIFLTILCSAFVVIYNTINTEQEFTLIIAWVFIQVAAGAISGYKLLKVARNK